MEVNIIKIGNSHGIRLSKTILEKYNLSHKLELVLEKGQIVLKPLSKPRKGWDEAFAKMRENEDDLPLIPEVFEDEISEEWK